MPHTQNDMDSSVGTTYKYYAFISYSSSDYAWGKKLQRKLEGYRMPSTLCSEHGWNRKPIRPVFFAPSDIQPGGLTLELQERLKASKHLIVICSPHSAKSEWVGKEIAFFHSLGRTNRIHFFIVDGVPHSGDPDTECFNPIIEKLGIPEILGANIHEKNYRWPYLNRERAYVQIITKLLEVEFDSIWQRHRRLLRQKIAAWTLGFIMIVAALTGVWLSNQPMDINVSLNEVTQHNKALPPMKDAIVTLQLKNEIKTDTIRRIEDNALFANIPHKALGKTVHLSVECPNWMPVDTNIILTNSIVIPLSRNPHIYGDVFFRLWRTDEEIGVANAVVSLGGQSAISDAEGYVNLFIPLEMQSSCYQVDCSLPLENNLLPMPTTKSSALIVK